MILLKRILNSTTNPAQMMRNPSLRNGLHERESLTTFVATLAIAAVAAAANYYLSEPSLETSLQRWIDAASTTEKPARELAAQKIKQCHSEHSDTLDLRNIPITSLEGVPLPETLEVLSIQNTLIKNLNGVRLPSTLRQIDNFVIHS